MTPQKLAWKQKWRNLFSEVERRVDCWLERWGEIGMKYQKERHGKNEIVWTISWKEAESTQTWLTLCLEPGKKDGRRRISLKRKPFYGVTIERLHQERNMKTKWAEIEHYLEGLLMDLFLNAAKEGLFSKLGCRAYIFCWNRLPALEVCMGGEWPVLISFQLCDDGTFKWILPELNGSEWCHIGGSEDDDPMALLMNTVKALALSSL
jgi:hypothetical protein